MNKLISWTDYIAMHTKRPPLTIVPKLAAPAPIILCAVRLADKVRYVDGVQIVREQFSHRVYEYAGFAGMNGEYVRLCTMHGYLYRKVADVRGLPVVAEKAA
jgi:hypothetical protein